MGLINNKYNDKNKNKNKNKIYQSPPLDKIFHVVGDILLQGNL